ncbi:hypothetical protein ACWKT5_01955 [Streptomyces avermitilis]
MCTWRWPTEALPPTEVDWTAGLAADEHGRGLLIIDCLADAHGDWQEAGHAVHWADITTLS